MNNQNKWNIELLYSFIFFITTFIWCRFNPFILIPDLTNSNYRLTLTMIGFFLLIMLSLYFGIQALKKGPKESENIFGFIPNNIPAYLAVLQIFLSLSLAIIVIYILFHLGDF